MKQTLNFNLEYDTAEKCSTEHFKMSTKMFPQKLKFHQFSDKFYVHVSILGCSVLLNEMKPRKYVHIILLTHNSKSTVLRK